MTSCSIPTIPNKDTSGDNLYGSRICWQPFVDWAWQAHGFQKDYWSHGFGYEDCCNTDLPLARTFNGIWLLNYSAEDYWNEEWSNNMLHWGRRYVREQIDDLRSFCGDGSAIAATIGNRHELYLGFFTARMCRVVRKPCATKPGTEGVSPTMRCSPAGLPMVRAKAALTPRGVTRGPGCTPPSTCGGFMPMGGGRHRPSARRRNNAPSS